ncbi:MAG: hypothetical protein K2G55_15295, partial [Lachnospiraceae bacterium]|nr:hypothetical protein [Lachnospiraceae bacterium]
EIKYERIDISTSEQFADFASKCYMDSWSENKYVSLKADIDLTGTEIRVVPVFNGIFDGVGHTISGFDYVGDGYVVGLFRYVESQGVIQNLTLKGTIESENQKECIGSLCGVNYGTIKNCTFQGTVSGRDTVGGIAGINGDIGIITGCAVKGRVTGYYSTGGIVGINHGTLNYCSNRAGINDNSAWVEEDDEMGSGMGILESLTDDEDSELYSGVDTGGIAGFSNGVIIRCTNSGTVGYEHTGYNIGGIAGRQSGIVSLSTNNGTVYGRKDIGGIVGQMEPFIEINEAESVRAAVDRLHKLIDKTLNDMQAAKNGVKRDFDAITSYSDGAVDAADALANQIGDFVDDNLDQVQSMTNRFDYVLEMTPGVLNNFETAENSFNNAVESLKRISDDMGKITDVGSGSYDVSKNKRITLLHTVGGNITSDLYNPEAGEQVTITAETDTVSGSSNAYRLSQIDVVKVTNGEKVTTSASSPFTFTMPAENVRVEAYFEPDNGIMVTSLDIDTISFDAIENAVVTDVEMETDDKTEIEAETDNETEIETEIDDETEETEPTSASFLSGAAGDGEESIQNDSKTDQKGVLSPRANSSVKITSNLSGNASYSYNNTNNTVTITVEPSGGYTVDYVTIDGSRKSPDSGNSYSFQVSGDEEYNASIQFKKMTTTSSVVDSAKSEIENAIREVQDTIDKINDNNGVNASELQKMLSAISTIIENIEILADIYGKQASDALKAVNNDLGDMSDHLKRALDSIKSATSRTKDIVNYMNDQPDITFTKLGTEYDYNRINLRNHLQAISDNMKLLGEDASRYSDVVNADLRAVNDQINVIFNLLADRLSDAQKMELAAFYNDVGDEDIDTITTGRTESCSNKGVIKGDINVGGIVGSMSIDDEDLDDSAVGSIEYELGRRFLLKCLVADSVNEGYITAKKNGAGGICGYMDHGIIVGSESYGSVESTEGDYVGGICGESHTIIEQCYALCSVAGSRNVGGIAGYADTLKNCYSMADVHSENGRVGAIAGQISEYDKVSTGIDDESEETDEPKVSGNYYVGENIHGIDNISYMGVAEPISYQDLLAVEQLPAQFWHLKVIYKIEDTYLGSEEVEYGKKLDQLNFPQIPGKEGFYGEWPDVSDMTMSGTMVVEAEYKDNVTVVQSNKEEDSAEEGQWQRPYALVEDIFTEDTVLYARISDMAPPEEAAEKQNVVYEVTLENGGIKETDIFSLRILNPYEDAVVYGYKDGAWTEIESKGRGQYLQVDMTGTHQYFCVVENTFNLVMIILCTVAAAVVLILLIVMIKKGRERRKQKRQKKVEEK